MRLFAVLLLFAILIFGFNYIHAIRQCGELNAKPELVRWEWYCRDPDTILYRRKVGLAI